MIFNKKILSLILSMTLVSSLLPTTSIAAYASDGTNANVQQSLDESNNKYVGNGYEIQYDVTDKSDDGFTGKFTVTNTGDKVLEDWQLQFKFDYEIESMENAEILSHKGSTYKIKNAGWNKDIQPGESITIDFTAKNNEPDNFELITNNEDKNKVDADGYSVSFNVTNDWKTGYTAEINIENKKDTAVNGWQLEFDFDGEIKEFWEAEIVSHVGNHYVIKGKDYNSTIEAGASLTLGLQGEPGDITTSPTQYSLTATIESGNTNPEETTDPDEGNQEEVTVNPAEADVDGCHIAFNVTSDWKSGYNGQLTVTNNTDAVIADWQIEFDFEGQIDAFWTADIVSHEGNHYVIKNKGYNKNINPGETITLGFQGTPGDIKNNPSNYAVINAAAAVTPSEGEGTGSSTDEGDVTTPVEKVDTEITGTEVVNENDKVYFGNDYKIEYKINQKYAGGYNGEIIITNTGAIDIHNWSVALDLNDEIRTIWNGVIVDHDGNQYLVKNGDWNQDVKVGQSVSIGFSANCDTEVKLPEKCVLILGESELAPSKYNIDFSILADWYTAYNAQFAITNNSGKTVEDWVFEFDFDADITLFWDAEIISHVGNHYVVKNKDYNANIADGQTIYLGFTGNPGNVLVTPGNYNLHQFKDGDSWKKETGNVEGYIKNADGLAGIDDVLIVVDDEVAYRTDREGKFGFKLSTDIAHKFEITKEGFIPVVYYDIVVEKDKTLKLDDIILIPDAFANVKGSASGRVVNRDNDKPLANITVNVRAGINNTTGEIIDTVVTGENGGFTTIALPNGTYTLEAVSDDIVTYYYVMSIAGTGTYIGDLRVKAHDIDLGDELGIITGTIKAAGSSDPIANATITIDDRKVCNSDDNGVFSSTVIADVAHNIKIEVEGYISVDYYDLVVGKGEVLNLNDIVLIPDAFKDVQGVAAGRVINIDNDKPLANMTVNIRAGINNTTGVILNSVLTGADGSFTTAALPNGTYTFEVKSDDIITYYVVISLAGEYTFVGDLKVKAYDIDLGDKLGTVIGGIKDVDLNPIAGAKVTVDDRKSTLSGADGKFNLNLIADIAHTIKVEIDGYEPIYYYDIVVEEGQVLTLDDIVLVGSNGVQGVATGKIVNSSNGLGLAGVTVNVRAGINNKAGDIVGTIVTGADGTFTTDTLPNGTYTLEIKSDDLVEVYYKVVVCVGASTSAGTISVTAKDRDLGAQQGTVKVKVVGTDSNPIAGAKVIIDDNYKSTVTGADGVGSIKVLADINHTVKVEVDGYLPVYYYDVIVPANGEISLDDVVLISSASASVQGTITGTVINSLHDYPLSGMTVNVRAGINNKTGNVLNTVVTGTNGIFTTGSLPSGTYTLEIKDSHIQTYYVVVRIVNGSINLGSIRVITIDPEFGKPEPVGKLGTINGSIISAVNNAAISGATIVVDGNYTYTSNTSGKFSIKVVANTNHTLTISKPGYITENYYNVTVDENGVYNLSTVLQVPQPAVPTKCTASGRVISALTGGALSGITAKIRRGISNQTGEVIATTTSASNGTFSVAGLDLGTYTVELSSSSTITAYYTFVCTASTKAIGDLSITPTLRDTQMRIVLTWGANPSDLDSHLTGPSTHVYYSAKNGTGAVLDVDDVTSYGPETITLDLNTLRPGTYTYYVHWYAGSGSWPTSNCKVTVYSGNSVIREFFVPNTLTGGVKSQWNVFKFDTETRKVTAL